MSYKEDDTVELDLWIVKETAAAVLFALSDVSPEDELVWIPKSQIEHLSKEAPDKRGWRQCTAEIREWIAQEKGLV